MQVIHVDFRSNRQKALPFDELVQLVTSLIAQGELILAETVVSKSLKISNEAAKTLIVAIMLDNVGHSTDTGTLDI